MQKNSETTFSNTEEGRFIAVAGTPLGSTCSDERSQQTCTNTRHCAWEQTCVDAWCPRRHLPSGAPKVCISCAGDNVDPEPPVAPPAAGYSNMFEAEELTVYDKSNDVGVNPYRDVPASAGGGMHIESTKASQFATLVLPNVPAGGYEIIIRVKKWNTRGIMQLAVAETPTGLFTDIGDEQDLYMARASGGYSDLEAFFLKVVSDGPKYLRFTVMGKNPSSSGYWIMLDSIFVATF
eukprot:gene20796-32048_t